MHRLSATRPTARFLSRLTTVIVPLLVLGVASVGRAETSLPTDLTFDDLANITVITASKHEERLFDAPAAVFVFTGDEVKRTGFTSLPDVFRYVPGMDVARITSQAWGVGARGFGGQFANQLLVLADGRTIYEPSFGGVFWETRDFFLPDLDRIEVVRGPGGSLWGANAVNGVINILSKDARETQGTLVYAGAGNTHEAMAGVRHGFQLGPSTHARVYAKHLRFEDSELADGQVRPDGWNRTLAGFRLDHHREKDMHFTLQGEYLHAATPNPFVVPTFVPPDYSTLVIFDQVFVAAHLLGRWNRQLSADSNLTLQAWWDFKDIRRSAFRERRHTFDFEFQHDLRVGERHGLNYGFGYRALPDHIWPTVGMRAPGRDKAFDQLYHLFAQDEIALVPEKLDLILGAKAEHNDYTGWELQPSARVRWKPALDHLFWAAVSRAVATPGRGSVGFDVDTAVLPPGSFGPGTPAIMPQLQGRVERSEQLLAWETGYRYQPHARFTLDVAAYFNDYTDLKGVVPGVPDFASTPPIWPLILQNTAGGETCGAEITANWQPASSWRLQASYSYFESNVTIAGLGRADGGASPRHKVSLRSIHELGRHWTFDAGFRFVDDLRSVNVPGYLECDLRVAWKPNAEWELSFVGQNLLHADHAEHPAGLTPTLLRVPRTYYLQLTWSR